MRLRGTTQNVKNFRPERQASCWANHIAAFLPLLLGQTAFYVFAQDNRFGDFLHRFAPLAALSLNRKISLLLGHPEVALKNSLGALHEFSGLHFFGKMQSLA